MKRGGEAKGAVRVQEDRLQICQASHASQGNKAVRRSRLKHS